MILLATLFSGPFELTILVLLQWVYDTSLRGHPRTRLPCEHSPNVTVVQSDTSFPGHRSTSRRTHVNYTVYCRYCNGLESSNFIVLIIEVYVLHIRFFVWNNHVRQFGKLPAVRHNPILGIARVSGRSISTSNSGDPWFVRDGLSTCKKLLLCPWSLKDIQRLPPISGKETRFPWSACHLNPALVSSGSHPMEKRQDFHENHDCHLNPAN